MLHPYSYLYVIPNGRTLASVASDFSANAAFMQPINRQSGAQDLVVQVPCVCEALGSDSTAAFFHDVNYTVNPGNTPRYVSDKIFSGLAWNFGDGNVMISGKRIAVHLPCGCSSMAPEGVLSYAVQDGDVLSKITTLFRSNREAIMSLNPSLINSEFLEPGWILLIPLVVDGQVHSSSEKGQLLMPV